jgi:hypothetical protein
MPTPEEPRGFQPSDSDPLVPLELPPELAAFLRRQQGYACITQATNEGTAYHASPGDVTFSARLPSN